MGQTGGQRLRITLLAAGFYQGTRGGYAFGSHDAKEAAGRFTGVDHQHFEVATGGKTLAQLPLADGGDREPEVSSHFFKWNFVPLSPITESRGKAGTHIALHLLSLHFCLPIH